MHPCYPRSCRITSASLLSLKLRITSASLLSSEHGLSLLSLELQELLGYPRSTLQLPVTQQPPDPTPPDPSRLPPTVLTPQKVALQLMSLSTSTACQPPPVPFTALSATNILREVPALPVTPSAHSSRAHTSCDTLQLVRELYELSCCIPLVSCWSTSHGTQTRFSVSRLTWYHVRADMGLSGTCSAPLHPGPHRQVASVLWGGHAQQGHPCPGGSGRLTRRRAIEGCP